MKKIAIDFDGTIVEHAYPQIGKEIPFAIETLKRLQREENCLLILWSVREGDLLQEAVDFCHERGLDFYAVNQSYPDGDGGGSRKVIADFYVDDRNLGGLPDWGTIYKMIKDDLSYRDVMAMDDGITTKKKGFLDKLRRR